MSPAGQSQEAKRAGEAHVVGDALCLVRDRVEVCFRAADAHALTPEPASIGGGRLGTVVAGLAAAAAAVALAGVILIRRRGKKGDAK